MFGADAVLACIAEDDVEFEFALRGAAAAVPAVVPEPLIPCACESCEAVKLAELALLLEFGAALDVPASFPDAEGAAFAALEFAAVLAEELPGAVLAFANCCGESAAPFATFADEVPPAIVAADEPFEFALPEFECVLLTFAADTVLEAPAPLTPGACESCEALSDGADDVPALPALPDPVAAALPATL